jgi:hypothetical protein
MERRACSPRRRGGVWRRCGGGLLRLLAMKGKKLDEFVTGWSFFRNRRMDLRLTGGIKSTATVAATLFMVAGKNQNGCGSRVLSGRGTVGEGQDDDVLPFLVLVKDGVRQDGLSPGSSRWWQWW